MVRASDGASRVDEVAVEGVSGEDMQFFRVSGWRDTAGARERKENVTDYEADLDAALPGDLRGRYAWVLRVRVARLPAREKAPSFGSCATASVRVPGIVRRGANGVRY
jgi:hypothetical protein